MFTVSERNAYNLCFTFHFGYTLIKTSTLKEQNDILYIPLWLYINFFNKIALGKRTALHSTLVIH